MMQVQTALADIGIPVMVGVWRSTSEQSTIPDQYCVYTTSTSEAAHEDDAPSILRTYVYLNLWSRYDPTDMRTAIRAAMYAAGFGMVEETDQSGYDEDALMYCTSWTWCFMEVL